MLVRQIRLVRPSAFFDTHGHRRAAVRRGAKGLLSYSSPEARKKRKKREKLGSQRLESLAKRIRIGLPCGFRPTCPSAPAALVRLALAPGR